MRRMNFLLSSFTRPANIAVTLVFVKERKKIHGCDDMHDEEEIILRQCLDKIYYSLAERNPSINTTILHSAVFDEVIKFKMLDIIELICGVVEEGERS